MPKISQFSSPVSYIEKVPFSICFLGVGWGGVVGILLHTWGIQKHSSCTELVPVDMTQMCFLGSQGQWTPKLRNSKVKSCSLTVIDQMYSTASSESLCLFGFGNKQKLHMAGYQEYSKDRPFYNKIDSLILSLKHNELARDTQTHSQWNNHSGAVQLKGCVEELSNFAFCCFGKTRLKSCSWNIYLYRSF